MSRADIAALLALGAALFIAIGDVMHQRSAHEVTDKSVSHVGLFLELLRDRSWWVGSGVAAIGFSLPAFVLAYLLILAFSIELDWLPVQGYVSIREGFAPFIEHLILPSVALGLIYGALIARITRASMLEVLSQDYIRTAQAKGLANETVLVRHALKNAAVPIVTVIGIGIALLISGVIVTETVFAIPGIGRLTVDAILRRDYPIIQGVILLFSAAYVLVNLAVDISYTLLDPRVRY